MTDVITKIVPERPGEEKSLPQNILIKGAELSCACLWPGKEEALRMADIAHEMLRDSIIVFKKDDPDMIDSIEKETIMLTFLTGR